MFTLASGGSGDEVLMSVGVGRAGGVWWGGGIDFRLGVIPGLSFPPSQR